MTNMRLFSLPLYLLGFFLLWEWLRPLTEITDTGGVAYFVIFSAMSLLINYFRLPWWIGIPVKLSMVVVFLHIHFGQQYRLLSSAWMKWFSGDLKDNAILIVSGEWVNLSNLFRSLLFFILLWLMTYLLRYWLTVRKRIFIFFFMTILYVTVLDTFTTFDGKWAIVRLIIVGFSLLGLLFLHRLLEEEQLKVKLEWVLRWAISLVCMVIVSIAVGFAAPKADPIWPDPVPFIQSQVSEGGNARGGVSKIGYSWDDSALGGPFVGDDRVVFEVKTPKRQYWRVETKDVYTGKGWSISGIDKSVIAFDSGEYLTFDSHIGINERRYIAEFDVKLPYPHIVQPYGFLSVVGNRDGFFQFDTSLNKVDSFTSTGDELQLKQYKVEYAPSSFSMANLRNTIGMPVGIENERLLSQYTQLPEGLPERVKELAYQLTAEYDNWYDKAKAIENHFQSNDFTYDQTNVAVPEKEQDYVDQFLFETKVGYCDNFSTSMVTMLRAAGIPARWAKGYTAGNYHGEAGKTYRKYEVTNNEAHSWVEVYFPEEGWVPFEPTKGFNNFATFEQDESKEKNEPVRPESAQPAPDQQTSVEKDEKEEKKQNEKTKDTEASGGALENRFKTIVVFIGLIVVTAGTLFFYKSKWMPRFLIRKYKASSDEETFIRAYVDLLKQLERFGLKKEPGQTLRQYAAYIDGHFETTEMSELTDMYERAAYSSQATSSTNWKDVKELWENLIKRTTG